MHMAFVDAPVREKGAPACAPAALEPTQSPAGEPRTTNGRQRRQVRPRAAPAWKRPPRPSPRRRAPWTRRQRRRRQALRFPTDGSLSGAWIRRQSGPARPSDIRRGRQLIRPDLFDPERDIDGQLPDLHKAMIRNNKAGGRQLNTQVQRQLSIHPMVELSFWPRPMSSPQPPAAVARRARLYNGRGQNDNWKQMQPERDDNYTQVRI